VLKNSGLTLIEVLVTLIIIGVAFVALAMSQITSLKVTRDSKQASIATQVGNAAMERAVKQVLDDAFGCIGLPPNRTCPAAYNSAGTFSDIVADGQTYSADYSIGYPAGDPEENLAAMARIDITVSAPSAATFTQLVSCMDIVPPPSFNDPAPCPKLKEAP
jgi:prepilin-type N-terminal cleavage/methylation domain-containing protein